MSTVASPYGLRPINLIGGTPFAGQTRHIKIASGYDTNIFNGDVVAITAGLLTKVTTLGTAASPFPAGTVGVFLGATLSAYSNSAILGITSQYWPANTVDADATGFVVDDPNTCFMIQANGAITQAMLGANFGVVQTAGTPSPGNSKVALDLSAKGTADTIAFKVIDFVRGPNSKPGDAFTDVIVKFNPKSHAYLSGTGI